MDDETTPNSTDLGDDVITNVTYPAIPEEILQFTAVCYFSMAIFGIISNTFAIIAFTCSKDLRSPPIGYMINLSVSEALVCLLTLPFWGAFYAQKMFYGNVDERTVMGMVFLGGVLNQVTLHTVVAISLNRMIAIRFPHAYKNLSTWPAVFGVLGAVWISGFLMWLPSILFYVYGAAEFSKSKTMFSSKKILGVVFQAIFCFFLPILITLASYCSILVKLGCCRRTGEDDGRSNPKRMSTAKQVTSLQRQPWKDDVTRTVFVVFVILLVCSVPHSVIHVLEPFDVLDAYAWFLVHILYHIQFVVDPIVYTVMSPRYRRAFAELLKKLCCGRLLPASMTSQASTGTSHVSASQKTGSSA